MSVINWIGENIECILWIISGIILYEYIYNKATRNYKVYKADLDEYYRIQYEEVLKKAKEKRNETEN